VEDILLLNVASISGTKAGVNDEGHYMKVELVWSHTRNLLIISPVHTHAPGSFYLLQ